MSKSVVIKNGRVVSSSTVVGADVLIEGERIVAVGPGLSAAETIDAAGLLVLPGGVDVHTHMELPVSGTVSADDFFTGTLAAAAGGTTTIIDFVEPARGQSLVEALNLRQEAARPKAVVDYGLHMTIKQADAHTLYEMAAIVELGAPTFKCYMAYAGLMLDDISLFEVLKRARQVGGRVSVHAEHGAVLLQMRDRLVAAGKTEPRWHAASHPVEAEAEATGRAIQLAKGAGSEIYIVHVSAAASLERIVRAGGSAAGVYAETCPQYLVLSDELYQKEGFEPAKYVMSPPLRSRQDQAALWEALKGGAIETVATDHCPFNYRGQKDMGRASFADIPNGVGGVETRLMLLFHFGVNQGHISLNQFVALSASAPARLFGLTGQKGEILPGYDADLVLWDPGRELTISAETLHQNVDYTPYEGMRVRGAPVLTMLRGSVVFAHGEFMGRQGAGRFLTRRLG